MAKVLKGGVWRMDVKKAFLLYYEAFYDTALQIAKRLEYEAKQILQERMIGEKSSGTLEESIMGVVDIKPNAIIVALMASALELGQWESSQGESDEVQFTVTTPAYDYASAVEEGTGEFGPNSEPIQGDVVFWMGEYRELSGKRALVRTSTVSGQPGKYFMRDALLVMQPQIDALITKVARNFNFEPFMELVK